MPGRERELLEITRKYESVAPNNPHALHMPTHIYTRLGDEPVARTFYQELPGVADSGTRRPALEEAQSYVAQRRRSKFPHALAAQQQHAADGAARRR